MLINGYQYDKQISAIFRIIIQNKQEDNYEQTYYRIDKKGRGKAQSRA